jgi:hypothetical protein
LGAIAGRLLTEMRNGKRSINSDEKIVLPITLLPGETLAPPPTTVASVQPSESP